MATKSPSSWDGRPPDHIVTPVASGSMFTKVWKGLNEFAELGLIDGVNTRMHVAQPEGCSPVSRAFLDGHTHARPVVPDTVAKSLAIGDPADAFYALRIARESGGTAVIVPEHEVAEGMKLLADTEGIFTETAGGVTVSALRRLAKDGVIKPGESVVRADNRQRPEDSGIDGPLTSTRCQSTPRWNRSTLT